MVEGAAAIVLEAVKEDKHPAKLKVRYQGRMVERAAAMVLETAKEGKHPAKLKVRNQGRQGGQTLSQTQGSLSGPPW